MQRLSPIEREQVRAADTPQAWRSFGWALLGILAFAATLATDLWLIKPTIGWWTQFVAWTLVLCCFGFSALAVWYGYRRFSSYGSWRFAAAFVTLMVAGGLVGALGAHLGGERAFGDPQTLRKFAVVVLTTLLLGMALAAVLLVVVRLRNREYELMDAAQREGERIERERGEAARRADEQRRQLVEMRLQLIRAQIEPHFLFNTLALIRRDVAQRPQSAEHAIDELIAFLRGVLPSTREACFDLSREHELVASYLALMRRRIGARLDYRIDIPPEAAAFGWPPGALLTLVENAVKHGIEPSVAGGFIGVSACVSEASMTVEVRDTGVGPGEQLGGAGGSGLALVREQLQVAYGGRARLVLEPNEPRGFVARIEIDRPPAAA